MSYKGFTQFLCSKGHTWHVDSNAHFGVNDPWCTPQIGNVCDTCGDLPVWRNEVDQTNGFFERGPSGIGERIDGFVVLEVLTKPVYCTCACGDKHQKDEATFKLPPIGTGQHLGRPRPY
jgi:hypothetical protein